jgi:hypothetical protein
MRIISDKAANKDWSADNWLYTIMGGMGSSACDCQSKLYSYCGERYYCLDETGRREFGRCEDLVPGIEQAPRAIVKVIYRNGPAIIDTQLVLELLNHRTVVYKE